jgi:hypothetical protein
MISAIQKLQIQSNLFKLRRTKGAAEKQYAIRQTMPQFFLASQLPLASNKSIVRNNGQVRYQTTLAESIVTLFAPVVISNFWNLKLMLSTKMPSVPRFWEKATTCAFLFHIKVSINQLPRSSFSLLRPLYTRKDLRQGISQHLHTHALDICGRPQDDNRF